ncbi:hypothetical protein Cadr_000021153 [Camelus dromedarius]|uniref:Uncharacterized protein n=1 Tax=Camelus dromedarius TaxID=9838 RepID=A0A5N4CVG9_CAMDR|nr:hypothetical protein Cadr_000021153 [Camelus dromedarius]
MEGFSPVLHQPWEMERPTGKYPHGPRRLTAGPFPGEPYGHKGAWYLGPWRRHLVPGASGSWWALLTARTGAHYVESNHMGAQAARLSVLRSAYAAASVPLGSRDAREHRASGFTGGRSLRARFKARLGSIIRPRLGAASSESPAKPGGSQPQRRRRAENDTPSPHLLALHSERSGQLSRGTSGDLGETPLRDLSEEGCTVSAHPRRSGALLWLERGALLAQRPEQRAHGGPLETPGTTMLRVSPGLPGAVSWIPRQAGLHAGALALGTFPAPAGALPPPSHCLRGPSATTRGGGAPVPRPRLGAGTVWCRLWLPLPGIASPGRRRPRAQNQPRSPLPAPRSGHGGPSQQPANAPPTLASSPEERPYPSPTLGPELLVPAFPRPANPWPDPRRLGQPPRRDPYPYSVKPQSAGRQAAPPGNSPALPSPAPGGSRPWLRLSVPEPQLPVRRQKPALLRREPPHRPSAPPPRRGLSSREGAPGRIPASPGALTPPPTLSSCKLKGGWGLPRVSRSPTRPCPGDEPVGAGPPAGEPGSENETSGSMGAVACDVESHHFLFLERKEVRRRKEVVVPPLTSATEKGLPPSDLTLKIKRKTHPSKPGEVADGEDAGSRPGPTNRSARMKMTKWEKRVLGRSPGSAVNSLAVISPSRGSDLSSTCAVVNAPKSTPWEPHFKCFQVAGEFSPMSLSPVLQFKGNQEQGNHQGSFLNMLMSRLHHRPLESDLGASAPSLFSQTLGSTESPGAGGGEGEGKEDGVKMLLPLGLSFAPLSHSWVPDLYFFRSAQGLFSLAQGFTVPRGAPSNCGSRCFGLLQHPAGPYHLLTHPLPSAWPAARSSPAHPHPSLRSQPKSLHPSSCRHSASGEGQTPPGSSVLSCKIESVASTAQGAQTAGPHPREFPRLTSPQGMQMLLLAWGPHFEN